MDRNRFRRGSRPSVPSSRSVPVTPQAESGALERSPRYVAWIAKVMQQVALTLEKFDINDEKYRNSSYATVTKHVKRSNCPWGWWRSREHYRGQWSWSRCASVECCHKLLLNIHKETHQNISTTTPEIAIPSPHEIYYNQLLSQKRGSPLWIPGPGTQLPIEYRKEGISIGDVGIITNVGRFDFLFNICQPAGGAINRRGVPEPFSRLNPEQLEIDTSNIYGRNTYLTSSSVRTLGTNSESSHVSKQPC